MAYQQIAKMYLRGSLVTQTIKNLNQEQQQKIEEAIEICIEDPALAQCRLEFCNALARTIKNEYLDRDIGLQDLRLAWMRAAAQALYSNDPHPEVITDPTQRKKWFQTYAFNYLRQILRENKLPIIKQTQEMTISADSAAILTIHDILEEITENQKDRDYKTTLKNILERMEILEENDGYIIKFDQWGYPSILLDKIEKLDMQNRKNNISILCVEEGIRINRLSGILPNVTVTRRQETLVKQQSFDACTDEDSKQTRSQLEARVSRMKEANVLESEDVITRLRRAIPTDAIPVLEILLEETRPEDYEIEYGKGQPKIAHMAKYLGLRTKDIKNHRNTIEKQCFALGIGS